MLAAMIEEGPESFTLRWKRFAAEGVLFARPEGSPLLEVELGSAVVQLLERTNPYLGVPGPARLLVQPCTDALEPCPEERRRLEVPSRGSLRAQGHVLESEGRLVVVDAGVPLLVEVRDLAVGDAPAVGAWVRFEAGPPIHGFVLPREPRPAAGVRDVDEAP